ncbi:MAG: sigma 54-interacting transcriptional regulator [Myxococcota bacterium]
MIRLEVMSGGAAGARVESGEELVRLGRNASNELALTEPHVSAEHASVIYTGEAYVLRDHHSTNGTHVRRADEILSLGDEPGRALALEDGDVILLGDFDGAVEIAVRLTEEDEEDDARIVSTRDVDALQEVEAAADRELLAGLYEAQKAISAAVDVDEVLDAVASEVFRFLPRATHVTLALRETGEDGRSTASSRYVPMGTRVRDAGRASESIPITRSVFKKVVRERAAVLAADARKDVGETASLMAAQILSTIGVPLWQGEQILGVIQVDNRAAKGLFKENDLEVLALLAQAASQGFARARLIGRLRVAEERQRNENTYLKAREERRRHGGIIGEARAMQEVFDLLRKVVGTRVTVLIEGETGTGKELVASAVHYDSPRREKLFVAQNCAALPENLLESELFGHKKGAFTGATEDKKGLFELADGGTLFLDEVGEMPMALQAKLLRVLQEGEVRPVGAGRTRQVDTRIVAATNRDLEAEVREGRFREDLFYRLKVFPIRIPPLRERREDIPLLAGHFLRRYAEEFGRRVDGFGQAAMEQLQAYRWPGNVRELENEVQRLVIQVEDDPIVMPHHLSARVRDAEGSIIDRVKPKGALKEKIQAIEMEILREALAEHDGNKSQTAKTLGITREGLHKKLKNYGMT